MGKNRRNKNVGGGAEEKVPAETFETPEAANEALAGVAKVTNIAAKQKENEAKKVKAAKAPKAPKVGKDGRPKLPPLPRGQAKSKPLVACGCGCGQQTRSKFAPGHDSRLRGWALRIARGLITLPQVAELSSEGERVAVEAHVKQLKKDGKWEALKTPQVPVKKAATAS